MMYDTAIRYEKFYIALMTKWAKEILLSLQGSSCKVFFAIPAYDDAGVLYHDPEVENISSALQGCFRALSDEKVPLENLNGFAIYCQWEMTETKWRQANNLSITEMTNDIITVDLEDINTYKNQFIIKVEDVVNVGDEIIVKVTIFLFRLLVEHFKVV